MKKSTERVIDLMKEMTLAVKNGSKTPAESKACFIEQVSKKHLEECLIDPDMDEDDINACKQMLKYFYNHEVAVN